VILTQKHVIAIEATIIRNLQLDTIGTDRDDSTTGIESHMKNILPMEHLSKGMFNSGPPPYEIQITGTELQRL